MTQVTNEQLQEALIRLREVQGDHLRLNIVMTRCTRSAVDLQREVTATTPAGTTVTALMPVHMNRSRLVALAWLTAAAHALELYVEDV